MSSKQYEMLMEIVNDRLASPREREEKVEELFVKIHSDGYAEGYQYVMDAVE